MTFVLLLAIGFFGIKHHFVDNLKRAVIFDFAKEARFVAGVARAARLHDFEDKRIAIAINQNFFDVLRVA
jgi:hypothetical protein